MAWCCQPNSWANVDPDLCRHVASQGHNELNEVYFICCMHRLNFATTVSDAFCGRFWRKIYWTWIRISLKFVPSHQYVSTGWGFGNNVAPCKQQAIISYTLSREYRVVRYRYSWLLFTSEDRICANVCMQEQSTNMTSQCQYPTFTWRQKSTVVTSQ